MLLWLTRDEVVAKVGSRLLGSSCRKFEGHIRAIIASGIPVTRALVPGAGIRGAKADRGFDRSPKS